MHLCSHNLRIGIVTDGNGMNVGPDNTLTGVVGEVYNKFFFSKSKR